MLLDTRMRHTTKAPHVVNAAKRKRQLVVEDQKLDCRQHGRVRTGAPAVSHDSSASGGAVQSRRPRLVILIHRRTSSDRANIVRDPDQGPSPHYLGFTGGLLRENIEGGMSRG